MPDLRLAVVTSYFPSQEDPFRGQLAYRTLRQLPDNIDVRVFCPLPAYPRLRWLQPRRYRYTGLRSHTPPSDMSVEYFEYSAIPLLSRALNGWLCRRELWPRLRSWKPDIILNYWLYPDGYAATWMGRQLGVPVVLGSIGSDLRRIPGAFTRFFTRRALKRAAAVITVSQELKERAVALGAPAERVIPILGGCDGSVYHLSDRVAARTRLGVDASSELILFIGNLLETKGIRELLEAFSRLRARRRSAELIVIGQGPLVGMLRECESGGGVRLLSKLSDKELALWQAAANIFTLPSYSEGCPNVVLEALACGRPVISTRVGGIPELVGEGDGILVPPADARALEDALEFALASSWDESAIASRHQRSWGDCARETLEVCLSAYRRSERV
jgi:teichuronic acid biosynthesis glycosyltransferase TuaC